MIVKEIIVGSIHTCDSDHIRPDWRGYRRQHAQGQTAEEEEADEFDHIDKLQQLGINAGVAHEWHTLSWTRNSMENERSETDDQYAGDLKKCKEAGFHTCQSLLMYPKKVISVPLQASSVRSSGQDREHQRLNLSLPVECTAS